MDFKGWVFTHMGRTSFMLRSRIGGGKGRGEVKGSLVTPLSQAWQIFRVSLIVEREGKQEGVGGREENAKVHLSFQVLEIAFLFIREKRAETSVKNLVGSDQGAFFGFTVP